MMIHILLNFPLAAVKLIKGRDVSATETKIERYSNENMDLVETRTNQIVPFICF